MNVPKFATANSKPPASVVEIENKNRRNFHRSDKKRGSFFLVPRRQRRFRAKSNGTDGKPTLHPGNQQTLVASGYLDSMIVPMISIREMRIGMRLLLMLMPMRVLDP